MRLLIHCDYGQAQNKNKNQIINLSFMRMTCFDQAPFPSDDDDDHGGGGGNDGDDDDGDDDGDVVAVVVAMMMLKMVMVPTNTALLTILNVFRLSLD